MNIRDLIILAIQGRKQITISYENDFPRIIEPHAFGVHMSTDNMVLRAYQSEGHSFSGKMGWKLIDVSKITHLEVLDEDFEARPGYKKDDKYMSTIYAQL